MYTQRAVQNLDMFGGTRWGDHLQHGGREADTGVHHSEASAVSRRAPSSEPSKLGSLTSVNEETPASNVTRP